MIKKKKSEPVFYSSQHCKTSLPQRCMMSFYKLVDPVTFKLPKIQQNKTGDIILFTVSISVYFITYSVNLFRYFLLISLEALFMGKKMICWLCWMNGIFCTEKTFASRKMYFSLKFLVTGHISNDSNNTRRIYSTS